MTSNTTIHAPIDQDVLRTESHSIASTTTAALDAEIAAEITGYAMLRLGLGLIVGLCGGLGLIGALYIHSIILGFIGGLVLTCALRLLGIAAALLIIGPTPAQVWKLTESVLYARVWLE